jgi:hypothetical protein
VNRLLLLAAILVQIQSGNPPPLKPRPVIFLSARTAECIAEVEGRKSDKATFKPEIDQILRVVAGTKLWSRYRYAAASKADIIIKITEDRSVVDYETISFKVFDPEDNSQIYSETRSLVDLSNDVSRLVAHFLAAVDDERQQSEIAQKRDQENARLRGEVQSKITCPNATVYANRGPQRRIIRTVSHGDSVAVLMQAGEELVVKLGTSVGYIDAACVEQGQ